MKRPNQTITFSPKSFSWKSNPKKNLNQNAKEFYFVVSNKIHKLRGRKLSAEKHQALKEETGEILTELGHEADIILLFGNYLEQKQIIDKCKIIENLSDLELDRRLLGYHGKASKVQEKSHEFEEAWLEVEAQFALERSLTALEKIRRQN